MAKNNKMDGPRHAEPAAASSSKKLAATLPSIILMLLLRVDTAQPFAIVRHPTQTTGGGLMSTKLYTSTTTTAGVGRASRSGGGSRRRNRDGSSSRDVGMEQADVVEAQHDSPVTKSHDLKSARDYYREHAVEAVVPMDREGALQVESYVEKEDKGTLTQHFDEVWKGRLIVLFASAVYGTNFAALKMLDDAAVPTGVSAGMRFTFAAVAVAAFHFVSVAMNRGRESENRRQQQAHEDTPTATSYSSSSSLASGQPFNSDVPTHTAVPQLTSSTGTPQHASMAGAEASSLASASSDSPDNYVASASTSTALYASAGGDSAAAVSAVAVAGATATSTGTSSSAAAAPSLPPELMTPIASGSNNISKIAPSVFWLGFEVGLWYCLGYLAQAEGLHTTDASKSAFFSSLAVLVVPLLDRFLKGKQLQPKNIASLGFAILGTAVLQLGGGFDLHGISSFLQHQAIMDTPILTSVQQWMAHMTGAVGASSQHEVTVAAGVAAEASAYGGSLLQLGGDIELHGISSLLHSRGLVDAPASINNVHEWMRSIPAAFMPHSPDIARVANGGYMELRDVLSFLQVKGVEDAALLNDAQEWMRSAIAAAVMPSSSEIAGATGAAAAATASAATVAATKSAALAAASAAAATTKTATVTGTASAAATKLAASQTPGLFAGAAQVNNALHSIRHAVPIGDVLTALQAVFFGVGYWRLESAASASSEAEKHDQGEAGFDKERSNHAHTVTKTDSKNGDTTNDAALITMGQLTAVATGSWLFCAMGYGGGFPSVESFTADILSNPFVIQALLWTGLVSTALALYLETVALKFITAAELTLLMTTISVWGSAFAFLTLGEVPTASSFLGGALILSGCVVSTVGPPAAATTKNDGDSAGEAAAGDGFHGEESVSFNAVDAAVETTVGCSSGDEGMDVNAGRR